MAHINYSDYFKTLSIEHSRRYMEKLKYINSVDPYTIKLNDCSNDSKQYPKVLYPDIFNYLVLGKSAYTLEDFKAYKGLEAYKQAICGWVRKVATKRFGVNVLILGNVLHSQRVNEACTKTWIVAEENGTVLCAHCDCVAGLGETCTHVAAVLFFIQLHVHKLADESVTDVKSYWAPPAKVATPAKISDMNFKTPDKMTCSDSNNGPLYNRNDHNPDSLKNHQIKELLRKLQQAPTGCVLHSIIKPFSLEIHKALESKQKYVLTTLYKPEYELETLENLIIIGSKLDLIVPIEECARIEKETDQQANSPSWFKYRAGRITASKFKAVCRTKIENPSMSLLNSVCNPYLSRFKSKATEYGCKHEKDAFKTYINNMVKVHTNFGTATLGLCLNPNLPYFGASPDGMVTCNCCGLGCIEIKCPYCARDIGVTDLKVIKKIGIKEMQGQMKLSSDHAYFYQIQMQLAVTQAKYCDFIVWSKNSYYCERILPNEAFWEKESFLATRFFKEVVLPELLGKYFTNRILEKAVATQDWDAIKE